MNPARSIPMNPFPSSFLDMGTMGQRLQEAMDRRGRKPPEVILGTGLSKGTVYNILNDTTKPEKVWADTATKICRFLGVSRDWLLFERGPMDAAHPIEDPDWSDVRGYAQAVGLGDGAEAQEYAETHKLKFRAEALAGQRLRPDKLAVMYGSGDSMLPRIKAGDAILFDTSDTNAKDGALYVIQVHGVAGREYQVKRAMQLDDALYFVADNIAGEHTWKKPRRADVKRAPIEIIGRVRWIGSWEG